MTESPDPRSEADVAAPENTQTTLRIPATTIDVIEPAAAAVGAPAPVNEGTLGAVRAATRARHSVRSGPRR